MVRQYTGKERVEAAFNREYADRVPFAIACYYNQSCGELAHITLQKYYLDPEKSLEFLAKLEELFPSDVLLVPGDPLMPEATAVRQELKKGREAVGKRLLAEKSALANMNIHDPKKSSTYGPYLELCHKVESMFKDTWSVALVPGIWTPSVEMRGAEQIIYDTVDDPEFVHELMRFSTEYAKTRGLAVAETGVNVVFGEPSASCSLISPKIYREFVKPYQQELFSFMKERVGQQRKIGLHMCGYIDPVMEDLLTLAVDWIEMDAPSSLKKMMEISQRKKVIRGNVSGEVLSMGTKEQIEEAVKDCIDIAAEGSAYILSPGCTMPENAPLENIRQFWEAAQKYAHYGARR